jgi:hypothetical protein
MNLSPAKCARQIRAELSVFAQVKREADRAPDASWWPWELLSLAWYRWLVSPARHVGFVLLHRINRSRTSSRFWSPAVGDVVRTCSERRAEVIAVDLWNGMATIAYDDAVLAPYQYDFVNCLFPDV